MNPEYQAHIMKSLLGEKNKAIQLRQKGYSYKEIMGIVHVAKSSLSLWLQNLPLTDEEKKVLKKRKDSNISLGRTRAAASNRRNRLLRERELFEIAKVEFNLFKEDALFLCGICLYWAEGAKRSSTFQFMNSDPDMINLMVLWCSKYLNLNCDKLYFRLYIHKPYAHERCEEFWSNTIGVSLENFKTTIYKPTNLGVKKRPSYKGCLRIEIPKGIHLLRKMQFWQKMLLAHFKRKVVV